MALTIEIPESDIYRGVLQSGKEANKAHLQQLPAHPSAERLFATSPALRPSLQ